MSLPDFTSVEPTRIAEARRRILVIERYLEIDKPTAKQATKAAKSIGISRTTLTRLAKAWHHHRDPTLMVHSRRGPNRRNYGIDQRGKEIAVQQIRKVGMSANISNVAPVVEEACRQLGIKPPSRPTIYNQILVERSVGNLHYDEEPCIVIGRIWFHIPIEEKPENVMPCALVAVALPERMVLAHDISTDQNSPPSIQKMLRKLADRASNHGKLRKILMDPIDHAATRLILKRSSTYADDDIRV